MARIPGELVERIKREVPAADLCREYGIELKPKGKDLFASCPWHEDSDPSFSVTPGKNLWNCLGGCGGGDNIQLVMRCEKISFRRAAEKLAARLGLAPQAAAITTRQGTAHEILHSSDDGLTDAQLMGIVTDFYHATFCNQPQAMAYLQKRKCFHPEAVKKFQIGYANRTLGYRVPATTAAGRELKERLQKLGVLRKETGHEHLNGSVVFPICDRNAVPVQMYGRKITDGLRKGTPLHLYLEQPKRGLWNPESVMAGGEVILCEAILDALTFWCAGFRNVTCSFGANGINEDLWALIHDKRPRWVICAQDNDNAGNDAVAKHAPRFAELGIGVKRIALPPAVDVNAYACQSADAARALASLLEKAAVIESHASSATDEQEQQLKEKPAAACPEPVEAAPEPSASTLDPEAPPEPLSLAAPHPENPVPPVETRSADEQTFRFGERAWRVRGLAKNLSFETMKVQLRAMRGERFHLDTLDMCNAKHRHGFVTQATEETGLAADILKRDIGAILLRLEELQEAVIRKTIEPQTKETSLSEGERETALALLRDPQLLDRILADYERCGIVGEATNKLVGYLAAVSRKLDEPLAVIIQSTSAAGKSSLMDAILSFVPEEERLQYSAMTGQSLYYLGDTDLKHKVLAVVEEEGAERASYALKLLQSEGELTIASTGKDPITGRMVTQEYRVEGPVMIMLTTTAIDIDEELMNRCLVITVDESREQTRAIHTLQREKRTLEGVRRKIEKTAILAAHRNAQRLLRPLRVVNPFARQLTFLDDRTRTRRDHEKYLTLIEAIAFLHQYQRPVQRDGRGPHGQTEYVEVIAEDIATANRIAGEVLGRSLDELPPQTRRLLAFIAERVAAECKRLKIERGSFRFSRRDVRGWIGWSDTALKVHLHRLEEMEYLLVHRAARGQSYVYEMLYAGEGQDGNRFVMGLLDAAQLTTAYDGERSEQNGHPSAPGQPVVRGEPGPDQPCLNGLQACVDAGGGAVAASRTKKYTLAEAGL
jgi:DNA primase catalytic core